MFGVLTVRARRLGALALSSDALALPQGALRRRRSPRPGAPRLLMLAGPALPILLFLILLLPLAIACAEGDGARGAGADETNHGGSDTTSGANTLRRFMTAPLGAEFTGMFVEESSGVLFANMQHPDESNTATDQDGRVFNKGTVGMLAHVNVNEMAAMGAFEALALPETREEMQRVRSAVGAYRVLTQQGDALCDQGGDGRGSSNNIHGNDNRNNSITNNGKGANTNNAANTTTNKCAPEHAGRMADIRSADGTRLLESSENPDFNAALPDGAGGFYLYSNWEDSPGGMSRIQLDGDFCPVLQGGGVAAPGKAAGRDCPAPPQGGELILKGGMLDFSPVNGTWVNCFGTLSPWGTPLTSEELYFAETKNWYEPLSVAFRFSRPWIMALYRGFPRDGSGGWSNPYDYGYIVEIGVGGTTRAPRAADVKVNKLELLGRFSHENSIVMPDLRTVFLSDDEFDVVLFKFVADTDAPDAQGRRLSSGKLYAAKLTQDAGVRDPKAAGFDVEWVEVAASDDETEIERAISDFDGDFSEKKYISDAQVQAYAEYKTGADLDGDGVVQANPYPDERVGFLESRKVAGAMGATDEFNKMEGVNLHYETAKRWWNDGDPARGDGPVYLYMAIANFGKGMSDDRGDIQLDDADAPCGLVYRMALVKNEAGLVDIARMTPALVGGPYHGGLRKNTCDAGNLAGPDNLVVLADGRVLIGEDTKHHENNMMWLFDDPAGR